MPSTLNLKISRQMSVLWTERFSEQRFWVSNNTGLQNLTLIWTEMPKFLWKINFLTNCSEIKVSDLVPMSFFIYNMVRTKKKFKTNSVLQNKSQSVSQWKHQNGTHQFFEQISYFYFESSYDNTCPEFSMFLFGSNYLFQLLHK